MRKILLSALALLAISSIGISQNLPPYVPTNGLVGWWPFNGNANDESGNGNNGTVNGATLTADRFGNQGSAYAFNGTTNNIVVQNSQSFQTNTWSISAWFKTSFMGYNRITSKDKPGVPSNDFCLIVQNGVLYISASVNGQLNSPLPICSTFVADGNWHHVLASRQNGFFNISIDGILCTTVSDGFSNLTNSNPLYIGSPSPFPSQYFNGQLDDIAIWNRALTPQEITQLYNQGICQQSITVTDTLLIHTGITSWSPIAYQNTLKVWPNPGNQDITIDAGNLSLMQGWKIKISNSLGQEVYPATLISQQQQLLDMSNWGGNGLYLLHLINPQGHISEVKKIVLAP